MFKILSCESYKLLNNFILGYHFMLIKYSSSVRYKPQIFFEAFILKLTFSSFVSLKIYAPIGFLLFLALEFLSDIIFLALEFLSHIRFLALEDIIFLLPPNKNISLRLENSTLLLGICGSNNPFYKLPAIK